MRSRRPSPFRSAVLALSALAAACAPTVESEPVPVVAAPGGALRFVENRGAWPESVSFVAFGGPTAAWIGADGLTLRLERRDEADRRRVSGAVLRLGFGDPGARIRGGRSAAAPVHVLRPDGGSGATCESVRLVGAWPGVDVVFRDDPDGGARGALAYDLHVSPGADLAAVRVTVDGATVAGATAGGGLVLDVPLGDGRTVELAQRAPVAWVEVDGAVRAVESRLRPIDASTFGFEVDGWNGADPLVVDPGFSWATYLGGGASDACHVVRAVPGRGVVVGGWAGSADFPTTPGAYRQAGAQDAYIAMLSEDGETLLWSTYLGGSQTDEVEALDVTADGSIVAGGWTGSPDFPTTAGVFQSFFRWGSLFAGFGDGFVLQLAPDGSRLEWSTFLGRLGDDFVRELSVLDDGSVIVGGETNADTFPTTAGAMQEVFGSGSLLVPDVFVTKLEPGGTGLVWSTYFGAFAQELLGGMAIAPDGGVVLGGLTASRDFRTTGGAYQRDLHGSWDGYVAKISADGSTLEFSTLLGGDGYEQVRDVALDAQGEIWVAGRTAAETGATFPTTADAFQPWFGTEEDGFVAWLAADGSALRASTVLGGDGDDSCEAVVIGSDGRVYVGGFTSGVGFPIGRSAAQTSYGGGIHDGFVAHFDRGLGVARSVTFVGGSGKDQIVGLDLLTDDRVVAVGTTFSSDLPVTAGAVQGASGGGADAMVVALELPADPDGGLVVDDLHAGAVDRSFAGGDTLSLVSGVLRNAASSPFDLEALEFVVAGAGVVDAVSLHEDVDGDGVLDPGEPALAGPTAVTADGAPVRFAVLRRLGSGEVLRFVVAAESRVTVAAGAEVIAGMSAPEVVVARDPVDGRRALVTGPAPLQGRTWIRGARRQFSGDLDGDGRPTCRDARRLAGSLGDAAAVPGVDPDADGTVTDRDVDLLLGRVVARPPAFVAAPGEALRPGGLLRVDGYDFGAGPVEGSIDGRLIRLLLRSERVLVFEVPWGPSAGAHELGVVLDGVTVVETTVEMR